MPRLSEIHYHMIADHLGRYLLLHNFENGLIFHRKPLPSHRAIDSIPAEERVTKLRCIVFYSSTAIVSWLRDFL